MRGRLFTRSLVALVVVLLVGLVLQPSGGARERGGSSSSDDEGRGGRRPHRPPENKKAPDDDDDEKKGQKGHAKTSYSQGYNDGYRDGFAAAKASCAQGERRGRHGAAGEYDRGYENGYNAGFSKGLEQYCSAGGNNNTGGGQNTGDLDQQAYNHGFETAKRECGNGSAKDPQFKKKKYANDQENNAYWAGYEAGYKQFCQKQGGQHGQTGNTGQSGGSQWECRAPRVTFRPRSGPVDTTFSIVGSGWVPGGTVYGRLPHGSPGWFTGYQSPTVDGQGRFSYSMTVGTGPNGATPPGRYEFTYSEDYVGCQTTAIFTVVGKNSGGSNNGGGQGGGGTGQLPGRYLALGDSVPYGTGLVKPNENEGPSLKSYPSLIASDLGISPFRTRQFLCSLHHAADAPPFDNLAINGAPSISNPSSGPDTDCYPNAKDIPHKTVWADELPNAGLKEYPPSLVTIQVGADDIRFDRCFAGLLRDSGFSNAMLVWYNTAFLHGPEPETCAEKTGKGSTYRVSDTIKQRLAHLRSGLAETIKTVRNAAPKSKIVVLNYYQLIPKHSTYIPPVPFESNPICSRLGELSVEERKKMRAQAETIQVALNDAIASVAKAHRTQLVKLDTLFEGRELCTEGSHIFSGKEDLGHPTAVGHCLIAATTERSARLERARDRKSCGDEPKGVPVR